MGDVRTRCNQKEFVRRREYLGTEEFTPGVTPHRGGSSSNREVKVDDKAHNSTKRPKLGNVTSQIFPNHGAEEKIQVKKRPPRGGRDKVLFMARH